MRNRRSPRVALLSSFMLSLFLTPVLVAQQASEIAQPTQLEKVQPGKLPSFPKKRIVGDYQYGSQFSTPPYTSAQIPYNKLTHIIHAGVPFDANGNLQVPGGFVEPALITRAHKAGVKVVLLIGGDVTALETSPEILKPC